MTIEEPGTFNQNPAMSGTHLKKEPLAAMRILLQRGEDHGSWQSASDPQNLRDNSDLEKSRANVAAGMRRSWASIANGTHQDNPTSVKNNDEATKGERF